MTMFSFASRKKLCFVYVQSARIELAETRGRTGDLQIFGLTLSKLSYRGLVSIARMSLNIALSDNLEGLISSVESVTF